VGWGATRLDELFDLGEFFDDRARDRFRKRKKGNRENLERKLDDRFSVFVENAIDRVAGAGKSLLY